MLMQPDKNTDALRARVAELESALKPFACACKSTDECLPNCPRFAAAEALREKPDGE